MWAYILNDIGNIQLQECAKQKIKEKEVLLKVKAAGICGSDIARIYQTGAHVHPLIPGHEFAGLVIETGKSVDKKWQGKRVGVFPLIPCKKCLPCQKKKYEMCRNYNYLGSRCNGGFAEYVAVPEDNLIELPDNISYEQAAMLEPMAVVIHAFRKVKLSKESNVVVCGLGTIGMLLVQLLVAYGIKNIFIIGNKEFQKEKALEFGIPRDNFCHMQENDVRDWIENRTNGKGTDCFFECVGNNKTIEQAIDLTAADGKVVMVGNPASDITFKKNIYWKILRNQLEILGSWNSSFLHTDNDDWHIALQVISGEKKHSLVGNVCPEKLITHRFTLNDLKYGFEIIKNKSEDYIKVMCINN